MVAAEPDFKSLYVCNNTGCEDQWRRVTKTRGLALVDNSAPVHFSPRYEILDVMDGLFDGDGTTPVTVHPLQKRACNLLASDDSFFSPSLSQSQLCVVTMLGHSSVRRLADPFSVFSEAVNVLVSGHVGVHGLKMRMEAMPLDTEVVLHLHNPSAAEYMNGVMDHSLMAPFVALRISNVLEKRVHLLITSCDEDERAFDAQFHKFARRLRTHWELVTGPWSSQPFYPYFHSAAFFSCSVLIGTSEGKTPPLQDSLRRIESILSSRIAARCCMCMGGDHEAWLYQFAESRNPSFDFVVHVPVFALAIK